MGPATESSGGYAAASAEANPTIPSGEESETGRILAGKKPRLSDDVSQDEALYPGTFDLAKKYEVRGSVLVPLLANDRPVGVLMVWDKRVRRFTDDEISLISAFANQAALALEKASLLNEAEWEKARLSALQEVSNRLAGAHDTDQVLDLIVNEAVRLVGASGAFLRLLDGDDLLPGPSTESVAEYFAEAAEHVSIYKIGQSTNLASRVMTAKKSEIIEDWLIDEGIPLEFRRLAERHGFHGTAAVPLLANDQSIGVLVVVDFRVRRFTDDEVSLLTAFADQASLAVEKARLLNVAEREKERSDALYLVANRLAGLHDTKEVLELIVNEAARLVGASAAFIRLLDGETLVPNAATESAANYPFLKK